MKTIFFLLSMVTIASFSCSPKLSPDSYWGGQRWVLVELKEVPVQQSGTRKDAFLDFSPSEKKFSGNGGCNRISGNYTLEKKNRIRFADVISTKMSCADIAFETAFVNALNKVDRFEVADNILLLKDGKDVVAKLESRSRGGRFQQEGERQ